MKILSINKFFHVHGGSDRYFFELNSLHKKAGHEVIEFSMAHPENLPSEYEKYFVSAIDYWSPLTLKKKIKAGFNILYSREAAIKIKKLIEKTKPQIAHIHLIYHQISPSIIPIIKSSGIPVVQTLHDYKPICPAYNFFSKGEQCDLCQGGKFYYATLRRCTRNSLPASFLNTIEMYFHHMMGWYQMGDFYITPSRFMLKKMTDSGLPSEKFVHIPNFVDPGQYEYSEESDNHGVYAGRLVPEKGVKTLITAMGKIKAKDFTLFICGSGYEKEVLIKMAESNNIHNVKFTGYLDKKELNSLILKSKFTILPSECYENCPMAVLESMAMGKPVIGSDTGGIPELIENGQDGILFNPGNAHDLASAIDKLLSDPEKCKKMGRAAREKIVSKFNPEVHYSKILSLYRRAGVK